MGLIELEPGLLMRSVFSYSEIYSSSKVRRGASLRCSPALPGRKAQPQPTWSWRFPPEAAAVSFLLRVLLPLLRTLCHCVVLETILEAASISIIVRDAVSKLPSACWVVGVER